jgi:hypothetical protein
MVHSQGSYVFRLLAVTILLIGIIAILIPTNIYADSDDPNDRKDCKETGTSHGDNTPSEKRFKEFWNKDICKLSDCIDDMNCAGEIRGQKQMDKYMESVAWNSSDVDMKGCQLIRFDLPDHGSKALQAYEIKDCAQGNY